MSVDDHGMSPNVELLARLMCKEYGTEPDTFVSDEEPLYGTWHSPVRFYYIPSRQKPAWEIYIPAARVAIDALNKLVRTAEI